LGGSGTGQSTGALTTCEKTNEGGDDIIIRNADSGEIEEPRGHPGKGQQDPKESVPKQTKKAEETTITDDRRGMKCLEDEMENRRSRWRRIEAKIQLLL